MIVYDRDWHNDVVELQYEKLFLGNCKGIALVKRGTDDAHVCFVILTEDDEQWFVSSSRTSSFWFNDLADQIAAARSWMHENCIKGEFGYEFK